MKYHKKGKNETVRNQLSVSGKLQYIWDYYKLPLAIAAILLYIISFSFYRHMAKKDTLLYAAMVNVAASEELQEQLSDNFLSGLSVSTDKNQITFYMGLYLTDDTSSPYFTYTQASQMKILASIDAEQLDVVFLDKEAFDAFAQNGYLYDLDLLFAENREKYADLYEEVSSAFEKNLEVKQDNARDIALDPSVPYQSETSEYHMGINLSQEKFIQAARYPEPVYLAVLANTPRTETVLDYIEYLFQ